MPEYAWILPVLGVVGVPLVIQWLNRQITKGDNAQQQILDRLEKDVQDLRALVAGKADSHQIDAMLAAIQSISTKIDSLNTLVLTELGKRPTRDEMMTLLQRKP